MSETLADRFMASRAAPIDLDGRPVHLRWDLPDLPATELEIRISTTSPRPQATCLAAVGTGKLVVGGTTTAKAILWSDTAPSPTVVEDLGDECVLTCSDGWGPLSFGDAVFRVTRRDDATER